MNSLVRVIFPPVHFVFPRRYPITHAQPASLCMGLELEAKRQGLTNVTDLTNVSRRTVLKLLAGGSIAMLMQNTASAARKGFALEDFFVGETTGRGSFKSWVNKVDRSFDIKTLGTWDGRALTLVEDFVFNDGERDRKTWVFTKLDGKRYSGVREDVVNTADIAVDPDKVRMAYLIDLPDGDGNTTRLRFNDTLTLIEPGKVLNKATVSKFLIPVASVEVTFTRT